MTSDVTPAQTETALLTMPEATFSSRALKSFGPAEVAAAELTLSANSVTIAPAVATILLKTTPLVVH